MPVTKSKLGRLPACVHPFNSPAPKAPLSPPPEIDKKFTLEVASLFAINNCRSFLVSSKSWVIFSIPTSVIGRYLISLRPLMVTLASSFLGTAGFLPRLEQALKVMAQVIIRNLAKYSRCDFC